MSKHYSDYQKMSVSVKDLKFDTVGESDKEQLKSAKKAYIRKNILFLILLAIPFAASLWFFINCLLLPSDSIFFTVFSLLVSGGVFLFTGDLIYGIIGRIKHIRKGVVLTSSRIQEVKDNRNKTYQYVFDIYMEDREETLMSYAVDKDTFSAVQPGDGVIIAKIGRKIKVLADPGRKAVMDVSNIT